MAAKDSDEYFRQQPVKPHGCICPFHPYQIGSYFICLFYAYVFYFVDIVAVQELPVLLYLFAIPYSILVILLVICGAMATCQDPTDPTVQHEKALANVRYAYYPH